jgi:osmotically-inducible protein OsmY
MKQAAGLLFVAALLAFTGFAQKPDNTGTNKRDRDSGAATAQEQSNDAADRQVVQEIRRAIMKDKSLSGYAHNVKIISQDGAIVLRGPVRSDDEKRTVESIAQNVAGSRPVRSEIEVAPTGSASKQD